MSTVSLAEAALGRRHVARHKLARYRVQVRGQLPRIVTCDRLVQADGELRFVNPDGRDILRVPETTVESWELKDMDGKSPGSRRSRSPFGAIAAIPGAIKKRPRADPLVPPK
jgi:hypothetical protein